MTMQTGTFPYLSQGAVGAHAGATVAACLRRGANRLATSNGNPQLEAALLLAAVLDCARVGLFAHPEQQLETSQVQYYENLVERRSKGEPLPYLTGQAPFFGRTFAVDEHVLIPRPETELLVERALQDLALMQEADASSNGPLRAVDVGTGSGCIAVSLALHSPDTQLFAVDISADALCVAEQNARRHGVAPSITLQRSDLLDAVPKPVDLIIANPPYVSQAEWGQLPPEVQFHEPRLALDGGPDGLRIIARLVHQAKSWLQDGGSLLMEIGSSQGHDALSLARRVFPDAHISLLADLAGRDRVLHVNTARHFGQV